MSLSKKIPEEVKNKLSNDPYMLICALTSDKCKGGLQWHHGTLEFGETYRRDEWWSIVPLCKWHHDHVSKPEFAQRVRETIFLRRLMNGQ